MKVSEITVSNVASYLRLENATDPLLTPILETAKKFIESYTGISSADIDNFEEFYIVVMVLCQDMYDNRLLAVDNENMNRVVETILDMHRTNLLPSCEV